MEYCSDQVQMMYSRDLMPFLVVIVASIKMQAVLEASIDLRIHEDGLSAGCSMLCTQRQCHRGARDG